LMINCNLRMATLTNCTLHRALLRNSDLTSASLEGSILAGADLSSARLPFSNLKKSNLMDANLKNAVLSFANLSYARLQGADFTDADLNGANLDYAMLPDFQITPQKGSFVAFKAVYIQGGRSSIPPVILKLEIPAHAKRTSSLVGRKCRASRARIISAYQRDGSRYRGKRFTSIFNNSIHYKMGEMIIPDSYNPDIRLECTNGIHFFMTFEEAANYSKI